MSFHLSSDVAAAAVSSAAATARLTLADSSATIATRLAVLSASL